jgi:ABC-type multidrug transport system fused ATPase/permease subunit
VEPDKVAYLEGNDHAVLVRDLMSTKERLGTAKANHELAKNRTSIIIAHRLSTIHHAKQIIVMDKGKIIEQGQTSELVDKVDGIYKKMLELA